MTNETLRGTAPMKLNLRWTGTDEALVALADDLCEGGLDSLDLGDAMGFFITETMNSDMELHIEHESGTLDAEIVFDLFSWSRY